MYPRFYPTEATKPRQMHYSALLAWKKGKVEICSFFLACIHYPYHPDRQGKEGSLNISQVAQTRRYGLLHTPTSWSYGELWLFCAVFFLVMPFSVLSSNLSNFNQTKKNTYSYLKYKKKIYIKNIIKSIYSKCKNNHRTNYKKL